MPSRELSFPVFDADNHMYEPQEALTKFLPDNRKRVIDYVEVRGRTKIVVRGHISEYIPNPTFSNVGLGMYSLMWPRTTILVRPRTCT